MSIAERHYIEYGDSSDTNICYIIENDIESDFHSMSRQERIHLIQNIASQTYSDAFQELERQVENISLENLREELLECGIIPEHFSHDSSEEKLWAKYCDILLSHAFNFLNIRTLVIRARGDSADILGTTDGYTIVGDAKAFRLSRSAKNQKDFKISALDDWRKTNTYACLVAPLYQFPHGQSQIYLQAESKNVTLLSYVHLRFLLDFPGEHSLEPLWQVAGSLKPSKVAAVYWQNIDRMILSLTGQHEDQLEKYKQLELAQTVEIGKESIHYWQGVIEHYQALSREEAIQRLIKAEKIDRKIQVIRNTLLKIGKSHE